MSVMEIKQKALQLGYMACGIIPCTVFSEYLEYLDESIKSFPESKEIYESLYALVHLPENSKSIIVCTQRYNKYKIPDGLDKLIGKMYLFDNRIVYSHEYRARKEFETYLKTHEINILKGSVPARMAAVKAGVGKYGHNNFIYDPEHGSYFCINTWIVDKELDYDNIPLDTLMDSCSEKCNKCIKACPTKALSKEFSIDAGKCIARISFASKDIPKEDIRSQLGLWIYGCDVCQDVCPLNKDKFSETENFPMLNDFEKYLKPENILKMDEETFLHIMQPRFWYIDTDALWLWKTNALRSMINSSDSKYYDLIKQSCNDADERIQDIAKWGCDILNI